ncbi:MAG TPA: heavy metal-associated domain-containing protein [Steroidobacteraceae bacterium]|nr:heavy metal-associated domain-containing protein [Steroidobacteraceae bacterium]
MDHQPSKQSSAPVVLTITGMTCAGCVRSVSRVLARVPGVTNAHVDLASGRATVTGTARAEDLISAVEAAGYGGQLS